MEQQVVARQVGLQRDEIPELEGKKRIFQGKLLQIDTSKILMHVQILTKM